MKPSQFPEEQIIALEASETKTWQLGWSGVTLCRFVSLAEGET